MITTTSSPTRGNPVAGQLAATFGAAALRTQLHSPGSGVGLERTFDLEQWHAEVTRLSRNDDCLGEHVGWRLEPVDDVPLAELAARADDGASDELVLALPGRLLAEHVDCPTCAWGEAWPLAWAWDARLAPCPQCDGERFVSGFARRERVALSALPAAVLARTPRELGLRAGDVVELSSAATTRHFEIAPAGVRVGDAHPTVVLCGLGNTGSPLATLVARTPGLERVVVVDPDRYEGGQQRSQAIDAADAGRPKVEVARERMRRIAPSLDVRAFQMPLELLPIGWLRGAIAISALDGLAARIRLAESARRAGAVLIDVAVGGGESLLARSTVYGSEPEAPCLECELADYSAIESVFPCDLARAEPASSDPDASASPRPAAHQETTP